jgi:hypothetical protein
MQTARELGDRIGMLLDLDQGSMTLWKGGEKMGVMVAEGLSGPLCWASEMFAEGDSSRIESAPAPPSPTEEELTAVKEAVETAQETARQQRREDLELPLTATDAECDAAEEAEEAAQQDDY